MASRASAGRIGGSSCCAAAAPNRRHGSCQWICQGWICQGWICQGWIWERRICQGWIWERRMHRILYVFLPSWAIDRLRRNGLLPAASAGTLSDDCTAASNYAPPRRRPEPIPAMGPGLRRDGEKDAGEELPFATVTAA